jgi:hypothetical protein
LLQTLKTLKHKFTNGLIKGLAYYAIGVVAVWLTYTIFGWEYKHAPGLHHIIALLFLLGGAGWTLYCFILTLTGLKSRVNFGILTVHFIAILIVVLYVVIDIRSENVTEYKTDPADIITINKDTTNNTASIVNGNGDTLYSQKDDSVLIDKIKNDTTYYR